MTPSRTTTAPACSPAGRVAAAYTAVLAGTGINGLSWSGTGLPAGLALAPAGLITGIPTTAGNFPVTLHEGLKRGFSPVQIAEICSYHPAKTVRLYPKKGTIAVGSDADLVVFDPERKHLITAATQHSKTDYNIYEGMEVTGTPEVVLLRGRVLDRRGNGDEE